MQRRIRNFLLAMSMILLFSVTVVPNAFAVKIIGPVGVWRFDENSGNIAHDSQTWLIPNNDGVIYGADRTNGKLGNALYFNGVNDYVKVPNSEHLNLSDKITIMAWVKKNSFENHDEVIVSKRQAGAYYLGLNGYHNTHPHKVVAEFRISGTYYIVASPNDMPLNEWVHLTATFDGLNMKLYINTDLVATTPCSGTIDVNNANLFIGVESGGASPELNHGFKGVIDEVKIFNYALGIEIISKEYERNPIASWRLDENYGNIASDETGNGNDGDIYDATWKSYGFSGRGRSFDGVNDYVQVPDSESLNISDTITIMAWVKKDSFEDHDETIVSKKEAGAYYLGLNGFYNDHPNKVVAEFRVSGTYYSVVSPNDMPLNEWVHLTATFDGSSMKLYINGDLVKTTFCSGIIDVNNAKLFIGMESGGAGPYYGHGFKGMIDEIKIYASDLRDNEIKREHKSMSTSLISHWSFNENTGNNVYDYGANNNTGTRCDSASWTSSGKFGSAMYFYSWPWSSYVEVPNSASLNITDEITIEAWVKKSYFANHDEVIVSKRQAGAYYLGLNGYHNTHPHKVVAEFRISGTYYIVASLNDMLLNEWVHLTATFDGSSMKLYVNGDLANTTFCAGTIDVNNANLFIGAESNGASPELNHEFIGIIDEVKIYDRALTEDEISEEAISSKTHAYGYAYASSVEPWGYQEQYFSPAFATDHNRLDPSRWSSDWTVNNPTNHDDEYIYLNFDTAKTFNTVRLDWQTAYGKEYEIQVSDNGYNWTTIHEEKNGHAGVNLHFVGPKTAKYVRMQGIKRGSTFGYSLWEFNVCP